MAKKRNNKIVKYKKPLQLNIGIVIFVIIFLYLMYYVFAYFTTSHISAYEVTQGSIAQNTVFNGLILRDETLYYAQDNGYANYYCKDGTKISAGSYIYSVDETGDFYRQAATASEGQLTDEAYAQLAEVTDQYLGAYSDMAFGKVYQFKYDVETALLETFTAQTMGPDGSMEAPGAGVSGLHTYKAEDAGVVIYSMDGLESVTTDSFTAEMFNTAAYKKESFLKREQVSSGDAVYKLINNEIWNVVFPVTEGLAADLAEVTNIKVEFKKDGTSAWSTAKVMEKDGTNYLILQFNNSMIRFASDRFVELELLLTDTSGLKIPNTAITTKEFLTVPKDYITKGGDSGSNGLLIQHTEDSGNTMVEFVSVSLILEGEEFYCIDSSGIFRGDVAIKPDSNERYTLKDTEKLEGVYNINKGYAVFKRIEKLFQNEEYTIIKNGTSYGVALYDHIALEAAAVAENEIIH